MILTSISTKYLLASQWEPFPLHSFMTWPWLQYLWHLLARLWGPVPLHSSMTRPWLQYPWPTYWQGYEDQSHCIHPWHDLDFNIYDILTGRAVRTSPTAFIHDMTLPLCSCVELFITTSSRAFPTTLPGTGRAINSTQVTYRAWAAGPGNSLNLQSQLGNGLLPSIARPRSRRHVSNTVKIKILSNHKSNLWLHVVL